MCAAYDHYDYPSYWEGREYEHYSESIALKDFLAKIPKIRTILEVGSGYGRLTSNYLFRANKVILSDPSTKLLNLAKKILSNNKITFLQSTLENLPKRLRSGSVDVIVVVRVLHHIKDCDKALTTISKLLKRNGYLILEFANKRHIKATLSRFIKGDLTFPLDIFPKDISSQKSKNKKTLPFINYHPDIILDKLEKNGFTIIETRSVSNIRSPFLKKLLPLDTLVGVERLTQKILTKHNIGPSIFVLAKKTG